jgi:hypothetical protein
MESSDLGNAVNARRFLSMPTWELKLTISFAGTNLVDLHASLTRDILSLKKMMEPFGDLIQTAINGGFPPNEHSETMGLFDRSADSGIWDSLGSLLFPHAR